MGANLIDRTGHVYGRLTVISRANDTWPVKWICRCSCGKGTVVTSAHLGSGHTTSCGCKRIKDKEKGNVYGRLTVVTRAANIGSDVAWLCKCSCGNECIVRGSSLRSGQKSCGCARLESAIDETGNSYGMLTVINRVDNRAIKKSVRAVWLCECSCGNKIEVLGSSLRSGNSMSCGCRKRLPLGESAFRALYKAMENSARRRDYEWTLTTGQVRDITKQPCLYCGAEPCQVKTVRRGNGGYVYTGIDRVNSDLGYSVGNVVPCCGDCNRGKSTRTSDEFARWIERVYSHWASAELGDSMEKER